MRNSTHLGVSCVLLNEREEFDTINHEIVLIKLESYGGRGICLERFRSHLNNRTQSVAIIYQCPNTLVVECGVPHESIL